MEINTYRNILPDRAIQLQESARKLEAVFISQMLKNAGFAETTGSFDSQKNEDQFASFYTEEIAKAVVESGGFGLSENLFQALLRNET